MNAIKNLSKITALVAELSSTHSSYDWEMNEILETCIKTLELLQKCNPDKPNEKKIVLTPAELDLELSEAYREGKKDGIAEVETEINAVEEEEDEDLRTCDKCGEDRYKNGELMRYDNMVENEEKDEWYCKGCADDSVEPCNCNSRMDIRGRCDPIKSAKQFAECSARVDTAYFHICNDYDKWEVPRRECWKRSQEHELLRKVASAEPYCLTAYELDEILELKEQDEENEDEFNCLCCGNFVSCAEEEDEGRYEGDDIICGDCVRNHYCDECDNFYEDQGFLAEYEKRLCCEECIEELKKQEESDEE